MKWITTLVLFSISFYGTAQLEGLQFYNVERIQEKRSSMTVSGSPYFENDTFQTGVVEVDGNDLNVFLRYNVAEERMEIKLNLEDLEVYQLPNNPAIEYFIGDKKFGIYKLQGHGELVSGYFQKLYEGNQVKLYGKPLAEFIEAKTAKTGYQSDQPPRIEVSEKYYVVFLNGDFKEVTFRKRDVRKVFPEKFVDDFLKKNSLRNVEDLVGLVALYDRQQVLINK